MHHKIRFGVVILSSRASNEADKKLCLVLSELQRKVGCLS